VERIAVSAPGRVEVTGRWFGVRGRRFVRPTLTMGAAGGAETRALAELEHKPWAAEDGDVWVASFPVDIDLDEVSDLELSVAPDIAITLRESGGAPAQPGDLRSAGATARAPLAKSTPELRRRTRAQDLDRLAARLAAAERAAERERERRSSIDGALEQERTENRRLRTELGQSRAELELARAAQTEVAAAAAELEAARRELLDAERRHDELTVEHDRAARANAEARDALHERSGALESARQALAKERAEAGRLRSRLAHTEGSGPPPPEPASVESEPARPSRARETETAVDSPRRPRSGSDRDAPGGRPETPAREPRGTAPPSLDLVSRSAPAPIRPQRPVNPALRHRTYWLGRAVALLVLLVVIAAVYLVIHTTLKP
jgi:hypothetical protein